MRLATAPADRQVTAPAPGSVRLGFKHCNGCDRDLPIGRNFYRSKRTGKPEAGCIDCRKRRSREYAHRKAS
jgi:hypothetical protein